MMTPETDSNRPPGYYVKRNLDIDEFVKWARGDTDRGSLRSVIGPPGVGKSTFLRQLREELSRKDDVTVLWFDAAREKVNDQSLHNWLEHQAEALPIVRFTNDRTVAFAPAFAAFLRRASDRPVMLLVDGFDEVAGPTAVRQLEESLLEPVIGGPGQTYRIVLTRRDEDGLELAVLRWSEDVEALNDLTPEKQQDQIRCRLATGHAQARQVVGLEEEAATLKAEIDRAGDDATRRPLEQRLAELERERSALLAKLEPQEIELERLIMSRARDDNDREAIVNELAPVLTPNPYINLRLLYYRLSQPQLTPAARAQACLRDYLARAGLKSDRLSTLATLAADAGEEDGGKKDGIEYSSAIEKVSAESVEELLISGILRFHPPRLKIEPVVSQLLREASPIVVAGDSQVAAAE